MSKLTGYSQSHRRIDGMLCMVEYVRTEDGSVWARVKGKKWVKETVQSVSERLYKGEEWCVHPRGLELKSKSTRLPKA